MIINEVIQVETFMKKFPPLWRDFKNNLKHKGNKMKFEDLIVRLPIEEDNKAVEKKVNAKSALPGANNVETPP